MSNNFKSWLKWLGAILSAALLANGLLFFGSGLWGFVISLALFETIIFSLLIFIQLSVDN